MKVLLTKLKPIVLQTKHKSVEEHKTLIFDGVELKPNEEKVEVVLNCLFFFDFNWNLNIFAIYKHLN